MNEFCMTEGRNTREHLSGRMEEVSAAVWITQISLFLKHIPGAGLASVLVFLSIGKS